MMELSQKNAENKVYDIIHRVLTASASNPGDLRNCGHLFQLPEYAAYLHKKSFTKWLCPRKFSGTEQRNLAMSPKRLFL